MKVAVIATATATAALVASVNAQDMTVPAIVACPGVTTLKPWVSGADALACTNETGYKPILFVLPTDAILAAFCPNQRCRALLPPTLSLRPPAEDCTVKTGTVKFYGEIVDIFNTKCKDIAIVPSPTTPAPTTVSPVPTTVAPVPTTVAPAPATVAPTPTTVAPAPTTVAPVPTAVAPAPTTVAPTPTTVTAVAPGPTTVAPEPTTEAPAPTAEAPSPTTMTPIVTTTTPCPLPHPTTEPPHLSC